MNTLKSIHCRFYEFHRKLFGLRRDNLSPTIIHEMMHSNGSRFCCKLTAESIATEAYRVSRNARQIPDGLYVACHIY